MNRMVQGAKGLVVRDRRRSILDEAGLLLAPVEAQRAFWRSYNTKRRRAARVGELVDSVIARQARLPPGLFGRIARAWADVLPGEYAQRTWVESFSWGRLRVIVDSSATRYVLARQGSGLLAAALNEALGEALVRRVDYRIGCVGTAPEDGPGGREGTED